VYTPAGTGAVPTTVKERLDRTLITTGTGAPSGVTNIKSGHVDNTIATDVYNAAILSGGQAGFLNRIGSFAGSGAHYTVIAGGYDHQIDCIAGTISGGGHNTLNGDEANTTHNTVGGGSYNIVKRGEYVTIAGGTLNNVNKLRRDAVTAIAPTNSTIGGGRGHNVYNANATISGGLNNSLDGDSATVGGGQANQADGNFSVIAGGGNNTISLGTLGAGQKNTIGGGRNNTINSATNAVSNTIAGGELCDVFGSFNAVGGGYNNNAGISGTEPSYAVIAGGLDNTVSGVKNAGAVSGGRSNTASADYATVTGGRGNTASAIYSRAHGFEADARHQAGDTLANGKFVTVGDAQSTGLVLKTQTTNATLTSMSTVALPDDSTFCFSILIVARRTDADNEGAGYKIEGVIDRNSGVATTALIGAITKTVLAEDTAAWDVTAIANSSSGGLTIQVTGEAAKTINWVARVTLVEVTG
jgi:hypothetical protein